MKTAIKGKKRVGPRKKVNPLLVRMEQPQGKRGLPSGNPGGAGEKGRENA